MSFLFVDRIVDLIPGKQIRGLKHITYDDHYLYPNQEGKLCFASSLIGESLGQLAAWNVMSTNHFTQRPVAGIVSRAAFKRPAYVGETLALESIIDHLDEQSVHYHSTAFINQEAVFTLEGALGPLLPMKQFISEEVVRHQFEEINRSGDWPPPDTSPSAVAPAFLKASQPMMCFDRILHSEPNVSLIAEKRIMRGSPYFADHFPYYPVLPLTVLLECKVNLAYLFLEQANFPFSYQFQELRKIKMNTFVRPGDIVLCHLTVLQQNADELILRYRSEVDNKKVCTVDLMMKALPTKALYE